MYNERGWLAQINDPSIAVTNAKLFSLKLNYDVPLHGAAPRYNGDIAEQEFNASVSGYQYVKYNYDSLNRLLDGNSTAGLSETGMTYDFLGNIGFINRSGPNSALLSYNYSGSNQLQTVTNNGALFRSYGYDPNGNATSDGLGNTIYYNLLDLPRSIPGKGLSYVYTATGQKLKKIVNSAVTEYINGIQYNPNGTIDFIRTEEGRANNNGGNYTYEYTLTDHLGNNRVTLDQTNGFVGEDDYYPFGLNVHRQQNAGNKYLYNMKEIQDELNGQYDYGARFYDPVIARWTSVDPLAEKSRRWSPYNYGLNNPIRNIDPDGMMPSAQNHTGDSYIEGPEGESVEQWANRMQEEFQKQSDAFKPSWSQAEEATTDGGGDEKPKPATTESTPKKKEERRAETGNSKEEDEREDKMFDGFMIHLGGMVSMASGTFDLASSDGVTAVTGTVSTGKIVGGFSAAAFGLVKMYHGYKGDKEETPGGLGEAIDRGFGGSGTVGQLVDLGLAGRPKKYYDFVLLGYGVATSQAFKNVFGKTSKSTLPNAPVAHPQVKIVPYFYQY